VQIEKNTVASFHYTLFDADADGEVIEKGSSDAPMVYLHGHRNIMTGLETALQGKWEGDHVSVTLPPERAYGLRKKGSIQRIPIKHLLKKSKRYRIGMNVQVNTENGARDVVIVKVGKFNLDVDTNHPFAGKTLTFEIDIDQVRAATPDELAHGHSHGIDGEAHHH